MNDPQPVPPPGRAPQFQFFAAPPPLLVIPTPIPLQPIIPDPAQLRGRPFRAHEFQFFAAPPKLAVPTVLQPLKPVLPEPHNLRGRPRRAHEFQFFASPGHFVTPVAPAIPGYGSAGAATFVLSLQAGAGVTHSWSTDVFTSYSGREQRTSPDEQPGRRFEGSAFVVDSDGRDIRGQLMDSAAQGLTFLLALPYEGVPITADSSGSVVTVASTTQLDWAIASQRCVIQSGAGIIARLIIQSVTSTTISIVIVNAAGNFIFGALGSTGAVGGLIMPVVPILLDPSQGFTRYPARVDTWSLRSLSNTFGFAGVDSMGVGASITTYSSTDPVPVASLTNDDLLIWDRVNAIDGTANEQMISRTEIVDMGALPFSIGGATVPDWSRALKMTSVSRDDWQWVKAFVRHLRGRQVAFLLPTHRPDLIPIAIGVGGITIQSASVSGGGDYVSWFAGLAQRKLAITGTSGAVQYVTVSSVTDNGAGVLTLTLDGAITETMSMVSFLELVRLESDDVQVTWDGATFTVDLSVVSVQDTVPTTPLFDTVLTTQSVGLPVINEFMVALGNRTLINWTSDRTVTIFGLTNTSGGNQDGQVVCISNVNTASFSIQFDNESTSASAATSRFRNSGLGSISGTGLSIWYRYNSTVGRWIELMRT